ncbi:bacteriohemerythrin [Desulfovibrio sp. JC022]|uniref:bacteriohemerythrin n=1 Tax=Desulfovibrio sp. JC022 TaxID=2593642 RepID=UPI0013D71B08|nr:bacteriohemerythrin [Desulfovibrio sp. JC022]NDV22351.1 bacteriohemerythrin [Desulfovibrio sp. JC022]
MGRVEWNDGLNIGIKEIDEQHKGLIDIINNVLEAFKRGENGSVIDDLLGKLKEYTVSHFNAEEKYMEEIEYPQLSEHRQLHAGLKNKVKTFQAARFHREEVSSGEIKGLLSNWLIEHILREDYKIVEFVKQGGAKDWSENIKE